MPIAVPAKGDSVRRDQNTLAAEDVQAWRYSVHWGSVHIADAALELARAPDAGTYRSAIRIEARGMFAWRSAFELEALSQGLAMETDVAPLMFERSFEGFSYDRRADVVFDPLSGTAEGRSIRNDDDDDDRKPVPENLRQDVMDPLAALVFVRDALAEGGLRSITVPIYDGERRYQVEAMLEESVDLEMPTGNGRGDRAARSVIPARLDLEPLAGFEEWRRDAWSKAGATVFFSNDTDLIPLRTVVSTRMGGVVLNLIGPCEGLAGCLAED